MRLFLVSETLVALSASGVEAKVLRPRRGPAGVLLGAEGESPGEGVEVTTRMLFGMLSAWREMVEF